MPMSWPNFKDYRDQNDVFTGMIAFQNTVLNFSGGGEPERIGGMIVTGNYFDLLGVKAAIGRAFLPEEDHTPGTHPVVVLSYGAWQRRFGGDPAIVGQAIKLNGLDYTVVGVAAEGFKGTDAIGGGPDCWVMYDQVLIRVYRDAFNGRRAMTLNVMGRLKPGVTEQQAETAMRAIGRRLEQDYPNDNDKRNVTLIPLNQSTIPPQERSVYLRASGLMLTVVGLALLQKMSLQFNPSNLQPLDSFGTIYPDIRIVDVWGILTVSKGALMSPTFEKIQVPAPAEPKARPIRGEGWTLELNAEWTVVEGERKGDYLLKKNQ